MKSKKLLLILFFLFLLSACQIFLGPDPDDSPEAILKNLWDDFDKIHAYLDIRMSHNQRFANWHDVYHNKDIGYAQRVFPGISESSLFNLCALMLRELNDPHVGLFAPGKFASSYTEAREDFSLDRVRFNLNDGGNNNYRNFLYGTFISDPSIGYIYITSFVAENFEPEHWDWGKAITNIVNALSDTDALILDIRNNRGGDFFIMEYIASHFVSVPSDYLMSRIKNAPGHNEFYPPRIHTIRPGGIRYTKNIVLLTNKGTVSAAEWFTMALRTQNHITHVGTATCGAFSVRINRPMINGWYYSISSERVTDMDGQIYEGTGVSPGKDFIFEYGNDDNQLMEALNLAIELGIPKT